MMKRCQKCGNEIILSVGEVIQGRDLVWFYSSICPCGFATEFDGESPIPAQYRDILIEQEGKWMLSIPQLNVAAMRGLRKALNLSLEALKDLQHQGFRITGTMTEMKRLSLILADFGFAVTPERISSPKRP